MSEKNSCKFPNVLVIGAVPLNQIDATGITLVNLFSGWPIDRIAQIYDSEQQPDPRFCTRYWRFASNDIPIVGTIKYLLARLRRGQSRNIRVSKGSANVAPSSSLSTGFLGACGDIFPFQLPKDMKNWVEEFNPDLIYSVLGSVRMMNIVMQLSEQFSLPIVPHFMDDWPSTAYTGSLILALPRLVLESKLNSVLSRSAFGLTICEDMAAEFSRRYKKNFDFFMNCVELHKSNDHQKVSSEQHIIKFGFTGGMHLNRWRSLITVAEILQKLKIDGEQVSFEIYAPSRDLGVYRYLFDEYTVVERMATLDAHEINEKLSTFDVLVHVESFLEEDSLYTRLSISTKIPQYMAAGRPILALGPESLSSIRYVENTGAGLAVTSESDMSFLLKAAQVLIKSSALRTKLGEVGRRVALEKHNSIKERLRFASVLKSANKKFT